MTDQIGQNKVLLYQLIIEIIISENRRIAKLWKKGKICMKWLRRKLLAIETKVVISYR